MAKAIKTGKDAKETDETNLNLSSTDLRARDDQEP